MANVTRKRTGAMLQALFRILDKNEEGLRASTSIAAVKEKVPPSDYELGTYPSGGQRFDKILRFATVDCVKAGWMHKDDGRWFVTEEGMQALKKYRDPEDFYRRATQLYRKWKSTQPAQDDGGPAEEEISGQEPNETAATVTLEEARDQAREQIAGFLHAMEPFEFQKLVGALLTAMGYHVAWISPPGKDDGIDLLAYGDPLGTRPPRIKVQVKRQDKAIPVGEVSAFMGNLGSEEIGIFVSAGGFTKDAEAKARTDKQHRVTLVNLDRLVALWVKHYPQLDDAAKRRLPLQPIYFLAPEG